MALSAEDVWYINGVMDRHLKNQRSWPWMRYVNLATGALGMVAGIWMLCFTANIPNFDFPPATTRHVAWSTTQPVSQKTFFELLESSEQLAQGTARFEATMAMLRLINDISGAVFTLVGFNILLFTLIRWNQHRRDRILITLLREKCAADLALPPVTRGT